jgi:hypothetical protein
VFLQKLNAIPIIDNPYPIELEKPEGSGWAYFFDNLYIANA